MRERMRGGLVARGDGSTPGGLSLPDRFRHDIECGMNSEPVEERNALFDLARTRVIKGQAQGAADAGRPGEVRF